MCRYCQFLRWPPNTVFLFWWSGDFQAPSAARKHGFRSVGFLAATAETGDLVVGSESAFSMDKLHHKDTVLVWDVSRRDFLCYSQAGPARVSSVLVLCLCLRIGSLSLLFHLFVSLHAWPCVSVPMYLIFVCCGRAQATSIEKPTHDDPRACKPGNPKGTQRNAATTTRHKEAGEEPAPHKRHRKNRHAVHTGERAWVGV